MGEAFAAAAAGVFALMIDIDRVRPAREHRVTTDASTTESLLVDWLGDLLAQKEISGLVFACFDVHIEEVDRTYHLVGSAWGDRLDPEQHEIGLEVKGISYLGLSVTEVDETWVVECVLDV